MKRKLAKGNYVAFTRPYKNTPEYGRLVKYNSTKQTWEIDAISLGKKVYIQQQKLTYIAPFHVTQDFLRGLVRYDLTYSDFVANAVPLENWIPSGKYFYILEDMLALINNIKTKQPSLEELYNWSKLLLEILNRQIECKGKPVYEKQTKLLFSLPKNDEAMAFTLHKLICLNYMDFGTDVKPEDLNLDLDFILKEIANFKNNKPLHLYLWSYGTKLISLKSLTEPDELKRLTEEDKELLRTMLLKFSEEETEALETLGYCYYGGNELFECDWNKARDIFLNLMENPEVKDVDKCRFANTLGYIYYYGRCTDGVPDYESAFKYFSLGAAAGIYESIYKLADLYMHGYFVPKNNCAAYSLVYSIYDDNLKDILKGNFDCKFADVALRMGNLCRDGITPKDDSYYFYTLADCAIRKRREFEYYGDDKVATGIQKELDRIRKDNPVKHVKTLTDKEVIDLVEKFFDDCACKVTIEPLKIGQKVTLERINPNLKKAAFEEDRKYIFECYPGYGYCNLINKMSFIAYGDESEKEEEKITFYADFFDLIGNSCLFLNHKQVSYIFRADRFERKLPKTT